MLPVTHTSAKRPRTIDTAEPNEPSADDVEPNTDEPTAKSTRTGSKSVRPLFCTLPPTCNPPHRPTQLANSKDLETHYATYHAHVCEEHGCGCVFPDARLLELHQTENHDPIAALRKERGEKIFACHLVECNRVFALPKTRRLHLIEAHGYPKQFFFAVTNKGVGGLLKKWGEGASMIRGDWKARDAHPDEGHDDEDGEEEEAEHATPRQNPQHPPSMTQLRTPQEPQPRPTRSLADGPLIEEEDSSSEDGTTTAAPPDVDTLATALDTLSLVPSSVRFGRGAHGNSMGHRSGRGAHAPMDVDHERGGGARYQEGARGYHGQGARGRGGRGRGEFTPGEGRGGYANRGHPPMPPRGLGRGMRGGRVRVAPVGRGRY